MAQFEIYFIGLMCFIKDSTTYKTVEILWDEDLEHVPFMYLGPTAKHYKEAMLLTGGTVSFSLPDGGASADDDPDSPAVHLKQWISGAPQLRGDAPLAATIKIPAGVFGFALNLENVNIQLKNITKVQSVSQIVLVTCPSASPTVDVAVQGTQIDTVSASSFIVIGNMSRDHDPKTDNHFQKYIRLTEHGTDIATVMAGPNTGLIPGAYSGNNFAGASKYITDKFPPSKTVGAPDCTITQWP